MLEGQRDQLYNQQYNMEQTSFALESMKDSVNQVKAMKAANKELKQAFGAKELNISNIDKLHDDMADMMVSPFPPTSLTSVSYSFKALMHSQESQVREKQAV